MKCTSLSPKHTNTPAEFSDKTWALVMEDQFCRFPSLLCFEDGPLHIDPLWRLFVIPWTITVKPGDALFPTRRSSQRGFRHTISHGYQHHHWCSGDLRSPNQHPVYLTNVVDHTQHGRSMERTEQSLATNCQTNYYFQSSDVMWLSLIIHLLHHVMLVTEMHLWSQRCYHDRRLNKLHTISFILYTLSPRCTGDIWYSTCASQPFLIRLKGIKKGALTKREKWMRE